MAGRLYIHALRRKALSGDTRAESAYRAVRSPRHFPFERRFSHTNAGDATASPESVRRVHRVDVVEPEAV